MSRDTTLSDTMRAIRERRGLTLIEMEDRMDVSHGYWCKYEQSSRRPALTMIARMKAFIDLTDEEVLDIVYAAIADMEDGA